MKKHHYNATLQWTGNRGEGTKSYQSYDRSYHITIDGKTSIIEGSSDPSFLGDSTKYNPEDLFLASISSCHMLWYLHLCSVNRINVLSYDDCAKGTMVEDKNGSGKFSKVELQPIIEISNRNNIDKALDLHDKANVMCFIANSVNFQVLHNAKIKAK